jgi:hypothetical protein
LWHCLDQPNQGWGLDAPFNSNLRALPMPRCKPGGGRQQSYRQNLWKLPLTIR